MKTGCAIPIPAPNLSLRGYYEYSDRVVALCNASRGFVAITDVIDNLYFLAIFESMEALEDAINNCEVKVEKIEYSDLRTMVEKPYAFINNSVIIVNDIVTLEYDEEALTKEEQEKIEQEHREKLKEIIDEMTLPYAKA